ncbi:MAG TPA: type II toxin-antitoxin system RelE/ParE family toxin [Pyrinomonadaceae bacterium]|nr:type II toxin-antitoxin system RelE/ParE family toxin [Pyrinomonadaceae bacterium]
MVEINWTREAQVWLKDIYSYIAIDNPDAAQRTIAGIVARVQLLKTHPRLGHRHEAELSREVRILLYGHYRIAYLIKSENCIDILGVFHGSLSIERYLL